MAEARRSINPDAPREGRARRIVQWALTALVGLIVVTVAAAGIFWVATPIPTPNADFAAVNTHLLYSDGKTELGTLSVQNREEIPLDQMPQYVKDAIVAGENPTFWTDPGISVSGILRAITTLTSGTDTAQGGSTITQQYVKLMYLSQERTLIRKLREVVIALKVGQEVPKEKILEGYLNTVYYGRGAYGLQAAAKAFFNKDASELDLQESLVLAAIVNSPGKMDPALGEKQTQNLLERYQYLINQMIEHGKLTEADKARIYYTLPEFPEVKKDPRFGGTDGYLMKVVIDELKRLGLDEATINGGGLTVVTTFDKARQDAAVQVAQAKTRQAAAEGGKDPATLHASLVSIDNATGGVLAMYGGNPDYVKATRNWATTTSPTGSTFKVWALVAALRQGVSLDREFKGYTFIAADGQSVSGHSGEGMVSLQQATTESINSAYVDLVTQLRDGPNEVIRAALDAGIPKAEGWDASIRLPMGIAEVTPVDNAAGFATLANNGQRLGWHVVTEVRDRNGVLVYQYMPNPVQGIEKDIATAATGALEEVTTSGTGDVVAALGYPSAGKTGTRYDGVKTTASWFVGYTKQITTAVNFVAGDSGQENLDEYSRGFYGSGYPAETWLAFMEKAMKGLPKLDFEGSRYKPTDTPTPRPTVSRTTGQPTTATVAPTSTKPTAAPTSTQPTAAPTTTRTTTTTATTATTTTRATSPAPTGGGTPTPPGRNP
nr:penicillin-binding protein [Propionibacterium sp.]